jgi:hypothetical protein
MVPNFTYQMYFLCYAYLPTNCIFMLCLFCILQLIEHRYATSIQLLCIGTLPQYNSLNSITHYIDQMAYAILFRSLNVYCVSFFFGLKWKQRCHCLNLARKESYLVPIRGTMPLILSLIAYKHFQYYQLTQI